MSMGEREAAAVPRKVKLEVGEDQASPKNWFRKKLLEITLSVGGPSLKDTTQRVLRKGR